MTGAARTLDLARHCERTLRVLLRVDVISCRARPSAIVERTSATPKGRRPGAGQPPPREGFDRVGLRLELRRKKRPPEQRHAESQQVALRPERRLRFIYERVG